MEESSRPLEFSTGLEGSKGETEDALWIHIGVFKEQVHLVVLEELVSRCLAPELSSQDSSVHSPFSGAMNWLL
jgi:hypothetical protein